MKMSIDQPMNRNQYDQIRIPHDSRNSSIIKWLKRQSSKKHELNTQGSNNKQQ